MNVEYIVEAFRAGTLVRHEVVHCGDRFNVVRVSGERRIKVSTYYIENDKQFALDEAIEEACELTGVSRLL